MGVFAKFVFTAAAVFGPGAEIDFPVLLRVTPAVPEIVEVNAYPIAVPEPCPPVPVGVVAPPCTPYVPPSAGFQTFCTGPGVFTFTFRTGIIAQTPIGGKIWLDGQSRSLLAAFNAASGAPAYVAASLQAAAGDAGACYQIRVETNGPVELMADPAVSFVTIGR